MFEVVPYSASCCRKGSLEGHRESEAKGVVRQGMASGIIRIVELTHGERIYVLGSTLTATKKDAWGMKPGRCGTETQSGVRLGASVWLNSAQSIAWLRPKQRLC